MLRCVLVALASIAIIGCPASDVENDRASLVIKNISVISVGDVMIRGPTDVVVGDGRILSIGDVSSGRIDDSTTIVEGTGKFLIPGLIDSHTHLNEIPGMTSEHERAYPNVSTEARYQIPRSFLYHGFTTVIDLNSSPDVIENWNSQDIRPHAFFCGASPVFDGYPMSFMPKPERYEIMPYFLYDDLRSDDFPDGFDPLEHLPAAVVNRIYADGGICVKTHYERGFGGRGDLPVPTIGLTKALIDAAHQRGMPVLLHANSESAQTFGVDAGVDAFAHGMWTWEDHSLIGLHSGIEKIVDAAIAENISLQPTVQVLYGEQDIHDPDYLSNTSLRHVLPSSLIDWYGTDDGQWWRKRMLEIPIVSQLVEEGHWEELDAPPIARVSAVLGYFAENGGILLFGSDTPSDPTFANPPGLNGRLEMDRWIESGVSPMQLFRAATVENAMFFGLADDIGTIDVGKKADLLILSENPLKAVSAYDSIEYVILAGRIIERSSLSALSKNH